MHANDTVLQNYWMTHKSTNDHPSVTDATKLNFIHCALTISIQMVPDAANRRHQQ